MKEEKKILNEIEAMMLSRKLGRPIHDSLHEAINIMMEDKLADESIFPIVNSIFCAIICSYLRRSFEDNDLKSKLDYIDILCGEMKAVLSIASMINLDNETAH